MVVRHACVGFNGIPREVSANTDRYSSDSEAFSIWRPFSLRLRLGYPMASSDYSELVDYDLTDELSQPTPLTSAPEAVSVATVWLSDETSISALDTLADVTTGASRLSDTKYLPSTSMVVTRCQILSLIHI